MDDEQNYKLMGGDNQKNNDEPTDKETAFLINDCSTSNSIDQPINSRRNNINSSSVSDIINNTINSFDINNPSSKLVIAAMLFHPILNLIIQDNPTVKKMYTKSQRKLIKRILMFFMLFCLIGFSATNAPGDGPIMSFLLKFFLILFLLIHTNIFNVTNFDESIKFWKKAFNKKD